MVSVKIIRLKKEKDLLREFLPPVVKEMKSMEQRNESGRMILTRMCFAHQYLLQILIRRQKLCPILRSYILYLYVQIPLDMNASWLIDVM